MPTVTKSLGEGTQSVILTVEILEILVQSEGGLGISNLARKIGTSKSRVYRHLRTLAASGYLTKNRATGDYEPGERLLNFCRSIAMRYDIVKVAEPIMAELREHFGHAVILGRPGPEGVYVMRALPGGSPIILDIRQGTVLPFTRSAQGKIAMAFGPDSDAGASAQLLEARNKFITHTSNELDAIRARRWASGQMREGLKGLAVPVRDAAGRLIASLAMLDTRTDMGEDIDPAKAESLIAAAERLAQLIGEASDT